MYPRSYAQYTLLERLATGGMSEVDLARRAVEEAGFVRFVVIKRIRANHVEDEAFVRMFKDEARITSELRHTNIAQVYDFGRVDDEYYLALEYVPGTDVRALLTRLRHRRVRMPVRIGLRIIHDTLAALHYAHTRTDQLGRPMHVVHRDVNPRNLMVALDGTVKLIDFGVAKATDRLERTRSDHFKGKVAYMAPEQVRGKDLDHRVDVFAVGLTLYELLTGAGPFAGLDQTQILYRLMQGRLPTLEVPREWGAAGRELQAVVQTAIAAEPAQRYADAEAMRKAVAAVAASFGGLPEQSEVAAWLLEQDPEIEGRVRNKMRVWADVTSSPAPPRVPVPDVSVPDSALPDDPNGLERSGTLERPSEAGLNPATVERSRVLRAPGFWMALGAGGVAVVTAAAVALIGFAIAVVIWTFPAESQPAPSGVVVDALPPEPTTPPPVGAAGDAGADAGGQRPKLQVGVVRSARDASAPSQEGALPRIVGPDAGVPTPKAPIGALPGGTASPGTASPGSTSSGTAPTATDRASTVSTAGSAAGAGGPPSASPEGGSNAGSGAPTVGPSTGGSGTSAADKSPVGAPAVGAPAGLAPAAGAPATKTDVKPTGSASEAEPTGRIGIACPARGLPVSINGRPSDVRTGGQVDLPPGTYVIGVAGYPSKTVELGPNMFRSVRCDQ